MTRTGRRPGKVDTSGEILDAARQQFAAHGYTKATIRGIAAAADVDPALVHHYFGAKRELFVAALDLPFAPPEVIEAGLDGSPGEAGERIARSLLGIWETEHGRTTMQALLRSAVTDEHLLRMLREFMLEAVLSPIVAALAPDRRQLRATLLASQVVGLALMRYVIRAEPLASTDPDRVVAAIAPTLQRYLTEDLGPA